MSATLDAAMLALLREVSQAAILPRYRNLAAGEIISKDADDVVTVAVREAEALLAEGLAKLVPGIGFVGEEAAYADDTVMARLSDPCWIVDPVDGTRNFANGESPFGILIALADGGEMQSGWIYDCLTERFCVAHRGKGAFVDGEPIATRATGAAKPLAAFALTFFEEAQRAVIERDVCPHYTLVQIPWCCAEQYPRLALGANDIALYQRTLPWDHAAGVLWLEEAGGKAARPDGSPYRVDEWELPGLIGAASPQLWDEMAVRLAAL